MGDTKNGHQFAIEFVCSCGYKTDSFTEAWIHARNTEPCTAQQRVARLHDMKAVGMVPARADAEAGKPR